MVTFIPPYMGEDIKSAAEKKMYDVLHELDLKNAYVLHSLGLPRHQNKIYGEIDFVVVCDRGVACLEIKGGRIECNNGKWLFTDRYGNSRIKPEGPFAQVKDNMFSLKEAVRKRFVTDSKLKNVLVACGVVFPDIEFKSTSEEIIREIIYDKKTKNITGYINDIFSYWKGRQHKNPEVLSPDNIKAIINYLRGDFIYIPTLSDRLNTVENNLARLTREQAVVMDALSANSHLLVEESAGDCGIIVTGRTNPVKSRVCEA